MDISVSTIITAIALLISISATYNAFLLRGGKLAWSQVLIVLGMVSLILSLVFTRFAPDLRFITGASVSDLFYVLGFVFLLVASLKLHIALK